jgi:tetratricopeptide (TPR) repeat protein
MLFNRNYELRLEHLQKAFNLYVSLPAYDVPIEKSYLSARNVSSYYISEEQYNSAVDIWIKLIDKYEQMGLPFNYMGFLLYHYIVDSYSEIGHILCFKQKKYQESEKYYSKGVEVAQKIFENDNYNKAASQRLLSSTLNSLSYAMAYQGKFDEALQIIDRAIQGMPNEANYYDSKGEILYMSGDKEGARKMWDKVISIDAEFNKHTSSNLHKLLFPNGDK